MIFSSTEQQEEEKGSEGLRDSTINEIVPSTVQHLISLYNKAIEYYSALNDERHMEYL